MVVNVVLKNDDLCMLCCVHWDKVSACANNLLLDLTLIIIVAVTT